MEENEEHFQIQSPSEYVLDLSGSQMVHFSWNGHPNKGPLKPSHGGLGG
jgi:hypothetical protein